MLNSLANVPQGLFLCKRFRRYNYTHERKMKFEMGIAKVEREERTNTKNQTSKSKCEGRQGMGGAGRASTGLFLGCWYGVTLGSHRDGHGVA
jgi:hypothetical protein